MAGPGRRHSTGLTAGTEKALGNPGGGADETHMESITLPGFESDAGVAPSDGGRFGLSGRWSTTHLGSSEVDIIKRGSGWMALAVALVIGVVLLVAALPDSAPAPSPEHTLPPSEVAEMLAPDSLGIKSTDLAAIWNEVDAPPRITGGLIRSPEIGKFDSFSYRFNETSLFAGAYDPTDDYVYALMASSWIGDDSASRLGLHLCHLVQPYSQECIDTFFEVGMDGKTLDAYADLEHQSEWELGEHQWRLTIADNVATIRVLAPGAG
jgi:hypothetical protein